MINVTEQWQQKYGYAVTYFDTESPQNIEIKWFANNLQAQQWIKETHNIVKIENLERY